MLFTDPVFLFLLLPLACVAFYTITPRFGYSAGFGALLIISLLFYYAWGPFFFTLLILSITANFTVACYLLLAPDEKVLSRRLALALGLLYNFATLGWFKYRFLFDYFNTNQGSGFSVVNLAIPIGISFYTFQQATFLLDAYGRERSVVAYMGDMRSGWGKLRGYIHHAFFVAFFPHLVIGPIVYLSEFQPQVEDPTFGRLRRRNLEVGLAQIAIGMFKKVVIADNVGKLANHVFDYYAGHGALPAQTAAVGLTAISWAGAIAYYAQLYFDFSGYSDMALGTARLLGVRFPFNFYSPLKAVGVIDFYRRWHITLTRVISRFLYMPLSVQGARFAISRNLPKLPARILSQWIPLLLNFAIIGFWHGARATFLLFGVLQGIWYIIETEIRSTKAWKRWRKNSSDALRGTLGRIIFFILMVPCFALFRAPDVQTFLKLMHGMFMTFDVHLHLHRISPKMLVAGAVGGALLVVLIGFLPNSIELLRRYRPGIRTYDTPDYTPRPLKFAWRPDWRWALFCGAIFCATLYFISRQPPFLYMGF